MTQLNRKKCRVSRAYLTTFNHIRAINATLHKNTDTAVIYMRAQSPQSLGAKQIKSDGAIFCNPWPGQKPSLPPSAQARRTRKPGHRPSSSHLAALEIISVELWAAHPCLASSGQIAVVGSIREIDMFGWRKCSGDAAGGIIIARHGAEQRRGYENLGKNLSRYRGDL